MPDAFFASGRIQPAGGGSRQGRAGASQSVDQCSERYFEHRRSLGMRQSLQNHEQQRLALFEGHGANHAFDLPAIAAICAVGELVIEALHTDMTPMKMNEQREKL